jgi:hypothetical protein
MHLDLVPTPLLKPFFWHSLGSQKIPECSFIALTAVRLQVEKASGLPISSKSLSLSDF